MRRDQERLRDILDAIEQIERYASHGRTACDNDELLQTWMVHHILIIGEAASRLSAAFRTRHAAIPWWQIIAMRHLLMQAYAAVGMAEVWAVRERNLPALKRQVPALIHAAP